MSEIILETENPAQPKKYLKVLATLSPILATIGFIALSIPLLGLISPFGFNSALFNLLSISPFAALALEMIAIVIGTIATKKLSKKSSARGSAAAGIYIGSVVFIISALATTYLLFTMFAAPMILE